MYINTFLKLYNLFFLQIREGENKRNRIVLYIIKLYNVLLINIISLSLSKYGHGFVSLQERAYI